MNKQVVPWKLEEVKVELRAFGQKIGNAVAYGVDVKLHVSYEVGSGDGEVEAQVKIDKIEVAKPTTLFADDAAVELLPTFDVRQLLDRGELEAIAENLLARGAA